MKLENIGFGIGLGNRFMMGEKTKKVGVFKGTPRDISNEIPKLLVLMAINNQDKLCYKYEENNRTFDVKVIVKETTKNNEII